MQVSIVMNRFEASTGDHPERQLSELNHAAACEELTSGRPQAMGTYGPFHRDYEVRHNGCSSSFTRQDRF
jgi:hypothetical protein